jgi:hypothetical protein
VFRGFLKSEPISAGKYNEKSDVKSSAVRNIPGKLHHLMPTGLISLVINSPPDKKATTNKIKAIGIAADSKVFEFSRRARVFEMALLWCRKVTINSAPKKIIRRGCFPVGSALSNGIAGSEVR